MGFILVSLSLTKIPTRFYSINNLYIIIIAFEINYTFQSLEF